MCWWNEFRSLAQQPDILCKEPQIYIYYTSAHIVCITQIYLLLYIHTSGKNRRCMIIRFPIVTHCFPLFEYHSCYLAFSWSVTSASSRPYSELVLARP